MDVYPDVAVASGAFKPGSGAARLLGALTDYARRQADGLIALGPCMRDRLVARSIPSERIQVVENWADGNLIQPRPWPPDRPLRVLYSGHFGLAHDFDTICPVMARLRTDTRFDFVFAGDGPRRAIVEDFCRAEGIDNARFLPYEETARLSEHFGACHIGLVTQAAASLGTVVPSKIYSLMAAGRPVVFVGPRQATPALTLEHFRCGWQVDPGDAGSLGSLLEVLAADLARVREAGARARQAFSEHYDLPSGVKRVVEILGFPTPVGATVRV
jgi:glycosyltransferase involved in cell wall biosynthesis